MVKKPTSAHGTNELHAYGATAAGLPALRDKLEEMLMLVDAEITKKAVADGTLETLTAEEVKQALAEPTPLAFWRKKRGLTQGALAEAVEISQNYLSSLESGARKGDPQLFKRLAGALRVRMEDIVE